MQPESTLLKFRAPERHPKSPNPPRNPIPKTERSEIFDPCVAMKRFSPETALLLLLRKYNVELQRLAELKVDGLYSTTKYTEIVPLFNLSPEMKAADFRSLQLYRSRIPISLRQILAKVQASDMQYRGIAEHDNMSVRCGYLNGLLSAIVCLFKSR